VAPSVPVRLVATDLDGTLLDREGALPEENARALRSVAARGVVIVLATVRKAETARRLAGPVGVPPGLVCEGGAVVLAPDGALLRTVRIPAEAARAVAAACDAGGFEFMATVDGVNRFGPAYRPQVPDAGAGRLLFPTNAEAADGAPTRLLVTGAEAVAAAEPAVAAFGHRLVKHYRRDGTLLDAAVTAAGATKEEGLAALLDHLGIPAEAVLAVGDSESDIGMLRLAGIGVAVGNARPEVRAAARWVAPPHDEAGVAAAVARFAGGG
jgi:hydroxymethylpyrimidine pyrophosphatase-like HAD family hydrolase